LRCLLERRPEARFLVAVRRTRKDLRMLRFLLTVFAVKRTSINDTATIRNVSIPSAIRSLVPYVHMRFAKFERFSIMGSSLLARCRATRRPKTNAHSLLEDGINVCKCSDLVDYRTASILPEHGTPGI